MCKGDNALSGIRPEELDKALKTCGFVWIDIENPGYGDFINIAKKFNLHKLAVEDAVTRNQRPKFETYPEHLFLVIHELEFDAALQLNELDIFLGKNFVITTHYKRLNAIEYTIETYKKNPSLFDKGADFLIYSILDKLVDNYFAVLERYDEKMAKIENTIFREPKPIVVNELFRMKKASLSLYMTIAPQAEIVNMLARREFPFLGKETSIYFRDVYDRMIRLIGIIDTQREIATGALEAYLSVVSNKMNEIMKVLTIIATIMMPLTLIAGIYGMNFRFLPELEWRYGYYGVLALMAVVAGIMLLYFRRKKWI
ncbi:MAG: magnesium/cobalt transporter CorA [Candidatus Diapherotrites archaeon]|nr:magnesium/cobalt transporter CorA [Candidatus Diapherotrites archaeon]